MTVSEQVARLDTALFGCIESQTTEDDRRSLLAIQAALADRLGEFSYLEIGSHLGGSLQAMLADDRCVRITSIDPRPQWQPDDTHHEGWVYPDNSTKRMLELLSGVPRAELGKLTTIEESTEQIDPLELPRPDFCFIDGEHTYDAVLRDARFCRLAERGAGVIAFHDAGAIKPAIVTFVRETARPHRAYSLRTSVFVVELALERTLLTDERIRGQLYNPGLWLTANRLAADTALLAGSNARRRGFRARGLRIGL